MNKLKYYLTFLLITFFIIFINLSPNYYAFLKTPKNYFYSGQASWFDPWDINVYVTTIKWGQKGNLLLKNLYTTDDSKPAFIYPIYTITGKLFSRINPFLLFNFLAVITGIILSAGILFLSCLILRKISYSLVALLLISLGGGLGGADLFMTSFTFSSSYQRPHEAIGTLLYLSSLILYFLFIKKQKNIFIFFSIFSLFFLIFFYPYYILSFVLITGIFNLIYLKRKTKFNFLIWMIGIIIVSLFTYIYLDYLDSTGFSTIVLQNLKNPGIISLLFGYGLFIPIFIFQFLNLKKNEPEKLFLNLWFLISVLLSFLSLGFARFYLRGLFFPLVLLSLLSLSRLSLKIKIKEQLLTILLIIFIPLSSFYIFYKRLAEVDKNNPWFYLPTDIQKGLKFIETKKEEGILTGYLLGNYIPAHTGKSVYFGHLIQTPKAQEKIKNLIRFYSGEFSEKEAKNFLYKNNISLVVYSDEEKKIGKLKYQFLNKIFQNKKFEIFAVN